MERLKERVAHIGQYAVTLLKWMVLGGVIGLVGGIIGSLFHIGVDTATQVRCVISRTPLPKSRTSGRTAPSWTLTWTVPLSR